jgi:hypothetical protein
MSPSESLEIPGLSRSRGAFLIHWLLVRIQDGPPPNAGKRWSKRFRLIAGKLLLQLRRPHVALTSGQARRDRDHIAPRPETDLPFLPLA